MNTATLLIALVFAAQTPDAPKPKHRGWFGAQFSQADDTHLRIDRIVAGSPASKAGLEAGDLVTKIDGAAVTTVAAFIKIIQEKGAAEVKLEIERGGSTEEVRVALERHPDDLLAEPDTAAGLRKVRRILDVAYHTGERHKLNLTLPETDKPFPTVMWIHAGAWSFGGREQDTALGVRLAERGIGVAAISHRLSSGSWYDPNASKEGVQHPAHIEDAAQAFAWLRANIRKHGGDPELLFVAGHSSGAQLAALLAMDPRWLKAHDIPLSAVRGAIPVGGCYDLPKYHAHLSKGSNPEFADAHLRMIFGPESEWPAASPATYVKDSKVPILVITENVPGFRDYAEDFKAVVPAGAPIEFYSANERTHQNITAMMSRKTDDAPRDKMIDFIRAKSAPPK